MSRNFLAALSFLTRIPIPASYTFDGADVGRATIAFPAVGLFLGLLQVLLLLILRSFFPPMVCAALLLLFSALITGALHLDAIADMADGFGGGRTREDILRIMRDHVIGAYGAVALILDFGLKLTALSYMIESNTAMLYLLAAPMLGRWASVYLGARFPYARSSGGLGAAITDYVGAKERIGATLFVVIALLFLFGKSGLLFLVLVWAFSEYFGRYCQKHIGGITGDTLGANTECVEVLILLAGVL